MKAAKLIKISATLLLVAGMMTVFTGCGSSSFAVVLSNNVIEITAENAYKGDTGMVETFTVNEGETAVIEPNLEKGEVLLQFISLDGELDKDADPEEAASAEPAFEVEISGNDSVPCELAPGDYIVTATVTDKANGTATIRIAE